MPNDSLKILIVDHDASVALALERGLSPHRATIETDAKAAYCRLVAGEWFDAVVCNASMHEMKGHELLATVRELTDPPVFVLISGDRNINSKADAILHKPFPVGDLLDLLGIFSRAKATSRTQPLPRERHRSTSQR
jgi:DNA-binding response OmpR family regulator